MISKFFTFEYDYEESKWNLPRGTVPPELKAQGVPHALWMHFWDYSQSVVERSSVRSIMKKKLRMECDKGNLSERRKQERETEILKLDEQTTRDFECLQTQAERLFPNTVARSTLNFRIGKRFVLEIQLLHSATDVDKTISLQYDSSRSTWNLPRDVVPSILAERGIKKDDWMTIWDHGFGVNQRAKEREHLNQLHDRELRLCKKSLSYMHSTGIASVDSDSAQHSSAKHIRMKMEKLQRAMEANSNNTKKGWQELQRKAAQKFEPFGVKVYLSTQNEQVCCGLQFHCKQQSRDPGNTVGSKRTSSFNYTTPSSIWLPTSSPIPSSPPRERTSPIPAVWMTVPKHLSSPKKPWERPDDPDENSSTRPKTPEKENAPPKPEAARKHRKKETSFRSWGQPIVLTYVHEDIPSQVDIEVSAPFTPISSFDDEDSHGYVVPPAPSQLPSSIGSSSSSSIKPPKLPKRVRFSDSTVIEYENPGYTKADRKRLWFTHEEREASRTKTKVLAQRVIDNRNSGGANNVVFMDMETEEEVCWRGLEHAKKGNLSSRQEIRRSFLLKVLEKQRTLTLDSWTKRPGTTEDPAIELQKYASRHSRDCRERAHKLAAQDAKEARAVYKESLRKSNLQNYSDNVSACGSQSTKSRSHHSRHQNDIFQDYCRQVHLATKMRLQHQSAAA